ncbi:MAG: Exonuclease VII small subunit [Pelagibacterales bacterium]|nr:Exonuclease VII small subunit [Pelagibacterales bacterium]
MKLKNIPADIRSKSIIDAQDEIKEIINKLEDKELKLEDSMEKYNRMIQLNDHIQEEFKKKLKKIRSLSPEINNKNIFNHSK